MRTSTVRSLSATVGLVAGWMASSLYAQVPGVAPGTVAPGTAAPGGVIPGQVGIGNVMLPRNQAVWQEAQLLIGHALQMAIEGTALKESAQQGGAQPGGQEREARRMDPAQQLMSHAQRELQESERMINQAGRDRVGPQALQVAADRYLNTLFALCGNPNRQGNERANTVQLSPNDKAAICLINHAVNEAIAGDQIQLTTRMMGSISAVGEQLQRHAQEMISDGRETVQRFLSQAGGENANRQDNAEAGQRGEASVVTLAQRGREVIDALQSGVSTPAGGNPPAGINPPAGALPTAPGGAIREGIAPTVPGGEPGVISGRTRAPGASNASESRGTTIPGGFGSGTNRGGLPGAGGTAPGAGGTSPR